MNRILEWRAPKPSILLQAMLDGLREYSEDPAFRINMDTFGTIKDNICYGCAATCTLQKLSNRKLSINLVEPRLSESMISSDRYASYNLGDRFDTAAIEFSINDFRLGEPMLLLSGYGDAVLAAVRANERLYLLMSTVHMRNDNWKEEIPKIETIISELQKLGL